MRYMSQANQDCLDILMAGERGYSSEMGRNVGAFVDEYLRQFPFLCARLDDGEEIGSAWEKDCADYVVKRYKEDVGYGFIGTLLPFLITPLIQLLVKYLLELFVAR